MTRINIGQVLLNRFRVDEFIAAGGMGAVYKVWDLKRQVPLAMKVLHAGMADDPVVFKRFQREAIALQKLTHPNIVPFYGIYQTNQFAFLLEAYVDGPTLRDIIRQKRRLRVKGALIILKGVSAALHYAHARGVVHCDVKPNNVMLDNGGKVYLTDFGIARHANSTATTFGPAGTPAYMSPEQISGVGKVTPATDVYALGVMAYELLAGRRPFLGNETGTGNADIPRSERLRKAHLTLRPPDPRQFNPHLPRKAATVLLKALAKKPENRYPEAWMFFKALCQAFGATPEVIPDRFPLPNELVEDNTVTNFASKTGKDAAASKLRRPKWLWPAVSALFLLVGCVAIVVIEVLGVTGKANDTQPPTQINVPTKPIAATIPLITETEKSSKTTASPAPPTITPSHPPTPTSTPFGPQGHVAFEHFTHTWNVDIYMMKPDGTDIRPILTNDANERYPDLSPDGRYLAYASDETGSLDIYVLDLQTSDITHLTHWDDSAEWYPAWSPDGRFLAFSSDHRSPNNYDLYIVSWPQGTVYSLTSGAGSDNLPDWSPDGKWIAFERALHGEWNIYLVHPDGSNEHRLIAGKTPSWSPDGSQLVYGATVNNNREIYLYNIQNRSQKRLTNNAARDQDPCWTVDGNYIFFESNRGGHWNVYRMRTDGSEVTQMTDFPQSDITAACGP